ncbi:nitrogenase-stabilizing/protective protein NifW [Celerinatantimonas sp. YJH-8]|uniref:nitrogenase-stabilizing/protective protein NifW n=1 Tax=Celerinatantimonas sp. YJH-8 TaxID=3228714 RepID=UPI0038C30BDA
MQWFKEIPGVVDLMTIYDFFTFFKIPFDVDKVTARHLHILKAFQLKIAAVTEPVPTEAAFDLAAELLTQAYQEQIGESISHSSPLAVYQRMRPSRVAFNDLFKDIE